MPMIKKLKEPSETFWLRKFINILEILFEDTDILVSDGEGVCIDTRAPSSGSQFGRRVDVLVSVGEQEDSISLASFEAKREDAAISAQIYQQAKNHRTNAGILNRVNCLLHSSTSDAIYIDLVGPSGYMVQVRRHDDYFICQSLGDFHIPTELIEIDFLEGFLTTIYAWKAWIVEQSVQLKKAQKSKKRRFSMVETVATPNERSSNPIDPINIYHSP